MKKSSNKTLLRRVMAMHEPMRATRRIYGNYCGPGYHNWGNGPINWVDSACQLHDMEYDEGHFLANLKMITRMIFPMLPRNKGPIEHDVL